MANAALRAAQQTIMAQDNEKKAKIGAGKTNTATEAKNAAAAKKVPS